MPASEFEAAIPAIEWARTHDLHLLATGACGQNVVYIYGNI